MSKLIPTSALILLIVSLSSCSSRLVGTWTLVNYETTTPGKQGSSLSNIGSMQFDRNGIGQKNIEYRLFDALKEDKGSFRWESIDDYVVIQSEGSPFSRTWIVTGDKKKHQIWKTTDGANEVQILELRKEKK
jgi:hypothetical protein